MRRQCKKGLVSRAKKGFCPTKKPEVIEKQRLAVRYYVEEYDVTDRTRRFLEAFAAILKGVLKNIEGVIARSPPLADDVAISFIPST